ncbi:hypothetical protein [Halorientalis pallida]|nr:hypothetical protein [Halorientalis pallida]
MDADGDGQQGVGRHQEPRAAADGSSDRQRRHADTECDVPERELPLEIHR